MMGDLIFEDLILVSLVIVDLVILNLTALVALNQWQEAAMVTCNNLYSHVLNTLETKNYYYYSSTPWLLASGRQL